MIIEVALFLLFGAIAGAFVVKAYEWRQDVLRALHQAERLEEVGSAPAIQPRCAGFHIARRYPFNRVTKRCKLTAAVVG